MELPRPLPLGPSLAARRGVPATGAGIYVPGQEDSGRPARFSVLAGASVALLWRATGLGGELLAPGDVSAATLEVADLEGVDPTTAGDESPAAVVFPTVRHDGRWVEDSGGYNVAVELDGGRLSRATTYRATLTLVAGGKPIRRAWTIQTTG